MVLLTAEEEVMYKRLKRAGPYQRGSSLHTTFQVHHRMLRMLAVLSPAFLVIGTQMWGMLHHPTWYGVGCSVISCVLVGFAIYNATRMFMSMFRLRKIVVSTMVRICRPLGPLSFQEGLQEFQARVDSKPKQV